MKADTAAKIVIGEADGLDVVVECEHVEDAEAVRQEAMRLGGAHVSQVLSVTTSAHRVIVTPLGCAR